MESEDVIKKEEEQKIPSQKELERELSDYLSKKYGDRIKIVSPLLYPQGDQEKTTGKNKKNDKEDGPSFDMKPEELNSYLDGYVVKQDQAKGILSTKICTHFNRIKSLKKRSKNKNTFSVGMIKNNVLLIGPTGVGKTYLIKLIAQKIGVPFIKGDATKFSETGYVGGDVEDLVRDLVYEANEDIKLAENGIIYIDEIDKIASSQNIIGHDVSRTGVQRALLKPMEETDVDLKVPHDAISQIQAIEHYRRTGKREKQVVNTKNILFIMSGSFEGITDIIKKRIQSQGIGFEADIHSSETEADIVREVRAQDLIEFGFESEFVGRLPVIAVLDELKKEDFVEILTNPNNPIILSKKRDFRAYDIDIQFEDKSLEKLAEMASQEKTGARGLVSAVERSLMIFEKRLPSTGIKTLLVTPELIEKPDEELKRIDSNAGKADPEMEKRFEDAALHEKRRLVKAVTLKRAEFEAQSGLVLYEERLNLIAELARKYISDIDSAFLDFEEMFSEIRLQSETLFSQLEIDTSFADSAIDEILRVSIFEDREIIDICINLASELEYGLKLIKDRIGQDAFTVTREAVVDPEKYIDSLIKKYYSRSPVTV
ncbi:MAG: AAA family ATPase [Deltaproteobacteria bacterium]|nr:AAA family ATPase [Deltaproteobacteria bacterium]